MAAPQSDPVPVNIISSASEYAGKAASGISFSTKARLDLSAMEAKAQKLRKTLEDAYLRAYDYTPLDIRSACNRSYLKSPFGSDPGNAPLNFADLTPGRREVYGIPFEIVDDGKSGGKSCVMAGTVAGASSVSMPVGTRADCLFFFGNCAAWANAGSAEYVIHYADGAKEIESVELKQTGGAAPIVFAVTAGKLAKDPIPEGVAAMRRVDVNRMAGNIESFKLASNTDAGYTPAARSRKGARVLTYQVARPEDLMGAIKGGHETPVGKPAVYAVEQRVKLAPGEKKVVGLICSWYAPDHYSSDGRRFGHGYENWFKDSNAVVEEIAGEHDKLLTDTKRHYDIIATSTLPKWYREMVQSDLYLMPACTWLTKDGIALTYETPNGCPLFGTMDVRYYGSFTQLAAFPATGRTFRSSSAWRLPATTGGPAIGSS